MRKLVNIESKIIPGVFFLGIILLWQYVVDAGIVERYILPSPTDIVFTLFMLPGILEHFLVTLEEALIGFAIAIVLALFLAVIMDYFIVIKKAFYPLIVISQTIPIIALAPLFVIWFGFGIFPKIIVVVLVCFFPILISLLEGLEAVDKDILNLFRTMGASKLQIFKLVKLPATIVNFFSGLRIAATYSIMGAVIGEWLGGEKGLGVYMMRAKQSYALDKVFAVIIIIVVLSLVLFKIIEFTQSVLTPWNKELQD